MLCVKKLICHCNNFYGKTFDAVFMVQKSHKTAEPRKCYEKAREGDYGERCSLHPLVVEHSTWRWELVKTKALSMSITIITSCEASTVSFCTPCKVQVGATVKEGGGEPQEKNLQEYAAAPMPPPFFQLLPQLQRLRVFVFLRALLKYHDNFQ